MNTWKHYVSDLVHGFCWSLRTRQDTGGNFPFLLTDLCNQPQYQVAYKQPVENYQLFLIYAMQQKCEFGMVLSWLRRLESHSNRWSARDFAYADMLLNKYYLGKDHSHGQS